MTNTVDSKVTPDDSWLDVPLLFLLIDLIDDCQVRPDSDFRFDAPIKRIIPSQMQIVKNFKTHDFNHDLEPGPFDSPPHVTNGRIRGERDPIPNVTKGGIRGRKGTIPGRVTLVGELTKVHTKQGLPSWLGED